MAPRKQYRRKAKGKKKGVAKKKALNTKINARLTCATNSQMKIANAASPLTNYTLTYVTVLGDIVGSYGGYQQFSFNQDYQSQSALYDEFCITGFTVKYNPVVNQVNLYDQQSLQTQDAQTKTTPLIHTWFDRDGTPLTNITGQSLCNKLGQFDSYRKYDCRKAWSRTVTFSRRVWLDTSFGGRPLSSGYDTVLQTEAGLLGILGIYGENLPWGTIPATSPPTYENYCNLEVKWHFLFRGKKALGITVDENGVVTMVPETLYAPIIPTMFPETPASVDLGIRASYDASGNSIPVLPGAAPVS